MTRNCVWLATLCFPLWDLPPISSADVLEFDGGGTVSLDADAELVAEVWVKNSTTLLLGNETVGAAAGPFVTAPPGKDAITLTENSTLVGRTGTILGGAAVRTCVLNCPNWMSGGAALKMQNEPASTLRATIAAGSYTGGPASATPQYVGVDSASGGDAAAINGFAAIEIGSAALPGRVMLVGGSATTENVGARGGYALKLRNSQGTIYNGSFRGGNATNAGLNYTSAEPGTAVVVSSSTLRIKGGSFASGYAEAAPRDFSLNVDRSSVEVSGGSFDGDWLVSGASSSANISGYDLGLSPSNDSSAICPQCTAHYQLVGKLCDGSDVSVVIGFQRGASVAAVVLQDDCNISLEPSGAPSSEPSSTGAPSMSPLLKPFGTPSETNSVAQPHAMSIIQMAIGLSFLPMYFTVFA